MSQTQINRNLIFIILCLSSFITSAQELLPPVLPWKGKSESLVSKKNARWITKAEATDFRETPSYDETMKWLSDLSASTDIMKMVSVGKTSTARSIEMVIVSAEKVFDPATLKNSKKPTLLFQAGIHAGEIDGKDAGLMLLRDIAFGSKRELIDKVNLLFIPILNVDGHERISPYNRVNQRGPSNMGWRTNAKNLNLNRDYSKIDSEEIRAVLKVIQEYKPSLYLDLHVTDGADYQYDITYGSSDAYSTEIAKWLKTVFTPIVDEQLKKNGHIPGPLMFAANDKDFSEGNMEYPFSPRFSNNYGDLINLPSVLVENHSLKPYKQRVLGTYVFLEATIKALEQNSASLRSAIQTDVKRRNEKVVLTWTQAEKPDSMKLMGIVAVKKKSQVTGANYVQWQGKPIVENIALIRNNNPDKMIERPKAYWVPSIYQEVIERLKMHGIEMEQIDSITHKELSMYRLSNVRFSPTPFEGHFTVSVDIKNEKIKSTFYPGSVRISTDQPLGNLVIHLLEPEAPDSFLQWGFFLEIFNRTEYIEEYVIEPLAVKMLKEDPKLAEAFERKKTADPNFAASPQMIYEWFYAQSPYVDNSYLLYPVGIEK